ncbi:MAG: hypothetical protein KY476_17315 [Planctomycetes bacterium]|nr:hypothetical protein [Planctomycetota bacterium]
MKLIASAADLDEMRSLPRVLVFIYVSWAMQARRSDAACREFLADLQREYQCEEIPVCRVDLSDQEGEVWVGIRKWLKDDGQPHDCLSYGGYGAMLWVREGKVEAYVPYLAEVECGKLMAMTRGVFELGAQSGTSGSKPSQ